MNAKQRTPPPQDIGSETAHTLNDGSCGWEWVREKDPLNSYYRVWAEYEGRKEEWRTGDLMVLNDLRLHAAQLLRQVRG